MKPTRRDFLKGSAAAVAGSLALGTPASAAPPSISLPRKRANREQPRHNDRAKGYLRFLWEKATTPDDWSYRGDEELPWGIQLPRGEIVLGLLWFNVGVEVGQLGFVALALALVRSFRTLEMRWPVYALRMPGYVVGVCGAWWSIQTVTEMFA